MAKLTHRISVFTLQKSGFCVEWDRHTAKHTQICARFRMFKGCKHWKIYSVNCIAMPSNAKRTQHTSFRKRKTNLVFVGRIRVHCIFTNVHTHTKTLREVTTKNNNCRMQYFILSTLSHRKRYRIHYLCMCLSNSLHLCVSLSLFLFRAFQNGTPKISAVLLLCFDGLRILSLQTKWSHNSEKNEPKRTMHLSIMLTIYVRQM